MSAEIEALKRFFDAINRFDMPAIMQEFDPEIVRIEPQGHATAGTHRGIDALRSHVEKGRGTWAEGSCDPEEFLQKGDKVVVYLHAQVRMKDTNQSVEGRFADGFAFRDGRIIHYQTFWERPDALKWAGIDG